MESNNTPTSEPSERNMLFISHAYPEDNLFSQWLSLRLAREGYPVWCDLTKLLGGEDFWSSAEKAIRDRTIKFIFVLSKNSNHKNGPLMELALARKVGKAMSDFVIPLKIDTFPHDDVNIEVQRLISIDFMNGWATGYRQLLEKLEEQNVPRDPRFTPDAVTKWWRTNYPANQGVTDDPENTLSNWFEFTRLPKTLQLHSIRPIRPFEKLVNAGKFQLSVPAQPHSRYIITFATAEELEKDLQKHNFEIANSLDLDFPEFSENGLKRPVIDRRTARNIIQTLFRQAFEIFTVEKGLIPYELSGGAKFHWFRKDLLKDDKIFFANPNGEKSWRQMVGFKSLTAKEGECRIRNWHFGIQARPRFWPFSGLAIRSHVAFTENGVLYDSAAKQHSARRNQCRSWYNDDWLGRILAAMSFLADSESDDITIPLSNSESFAVSRLPIVFESPVSFEVSGAHALNGDEENETQDEENLDDLGGDDDGDDDEN